jgi:hypothetical protein
MVAFVRPRFELGRTVATPAVLVALAQAGQSPAEFLDRHVTGDWGDLCAEDKQANEDALQDGSRILSAYHTSAGTKIWIITEATDDDGHRAATTILLPDEY